MTLEFTRKEADLIESKDLLMLSTVSRNGWPHIVPVGYVYLGGRFYAPADPKSKKVRNLTQNQRATILVDDDETESAVMLECESKMLSGPEGQKFRDYIRRVKGWQNNETTVIILLTPLAKASWFLKDKSCGKACLGVGRFTSRIATAEPN